MLDIIWGIVLLTALSLAAGAGGRRLGATRGAAWLLALGALWACFYSVVLYDRLFIVRLLPYPVLAFVAGNCLLLPTVIGLAALALPKLQGSTLRRLALVAPLVLGGGWHAFSPLFGQPPATESIAPGTDGVVRQTSESSCSAASAATVLTQAKIAATEAEMAQLCLTRSPGTPMLGVYWGLRKKASGSASQVFVLSHATLADLRQTSQAGPVLISVGLDRWQRGYDPRYVTEWGWTPGKRHAVVLFGFLPEGKIDIGDPSLGREKWKEEALSVLWNGEGIQLRREE